MGKWWKKRDQIGELGNSPRKVDVALGGNRDREMRMDWGYVLQVELQIRIMD